MVWVSRRVEVVTFLGCGCIIQAVESWGISKSVLRLVKAGCLPGYIHRGRLVPSMGTCLKEFGGRTGRYNTNPK
ncbi:hypothetical protein PR001_g14043 [Phytophthora rubi]|uniref:Uncharacterized protein n=2 Tax=Phytophthora TaxID=4783 RepID=A0A6A3LHC1_9STRA|nr:hypothetical protein PR002_g14317 [Phytophthora rubi]KAE9018762.1 hypothetical protein PR001_g14043 [Phytophthora rubi]KAE9330475.1 hypothetical protein PF008_g15718 [Phytophthora fragariae]